MPRRWQRGRRVRAMLARASGGAVARRAWVCGLCSRWLSCEPKPAAW